MWLFYRHVCVVTWNSILKLFICFRLEFEARNCKKEAKELEIIKQMEEQMDKIKLKSC